MRAARHPKKFGRGIYLVWKSSNERRAPPLPRLLRFRLRLVGSLYFRFTSTQDHRATALSCQSKNAGLGLGIGWKVKTRILEDAKPGVGHLANTQAICNKPYVSARG